MSLRQAQQPMEYVQVLRDNPGNWTPWPATW